jgi:hypothetical protein
VQVEDVARIGFATRWPPQQQRHLAVSPSLLGQVVVDDQRVLAPIAEEFAHGATGVGCDVLQGRGLGRAGGDDDGMLHRAVLLQLGDHVGDGGLLLPDRNVDALNAGALLVDDRVDGHGGLAGLAVADNQLALTAADRHHGVDRLQAGLHRLAHRLTGDDARRDLLDWRHIVGIDRALAIDRHAQGIHHAAQHGLAHRHLEDTAGGLDHRALGDVLVLAEDHGADGVLLQVERETEGVAREFEHFAIGNVGQTVDTNDTVGNRHDRAFVPRLGGGLELLDLLLDEIADLGSFD